MYHSMMHLFMIAFGVSFYDAVFTRIMILTFAEIKFTCRDIEYV